MSSSPAPSGAGDVLSEPRWDTATRLSERCPMGEWQRVPWGSEDLASSFLGESGRSGEGFSRAPARRAGEWAGVKPVSNSPSSVTVAKVCGATTCRPTRAARISLAVGST